MAKKKRRKKGLLSSLKDMLGGGPASDAEYGRKFSGRSVAATASNRDLLAPFHPPSLDLDPLVHPTRNKAPRIPEVLTLGTLLLSQRHGIKCVLLEPLEEVDIRRLKAICLRKLKPDQAIYLPMGTQVLKEEVLHQGRQFAVNLRKGTLFLSPGGHPDGYLLDALVLPLSRELGSVPEFLALNEVSAKRHLQKLVDIPPSFSLLKEDQLYDEGARARKVEKGTLIISRGAAMTGLLLEDLQLPLKKSVTDLKSLFTIKTTYHSYPIETLVQQATKAGGQEIPIERGTFLFSPHGKVYFVWREDVKADAQKLTFWSRAAQITDPGIVLVSTTKSNFIGGPGQVITQDELNYLRDVFREVGVTNLYRETLLLDRNVFYKFTSDMPYAHSGKFRSYLGKSVVIINTFRKGTFNVELGGSKIEVTDLDMQLVRQHLQPTGRILIKIGTLLRIRDERHGDWIYRATNNLFYPYETFTRPYMEEWIPESIAFHERAEKTSTVIGPQDEPHELDKGASGEPLADLLALINNELHNERVVFVLDGTLFHWRGRLFRVNEELVFRPQHHSTVENEDFEAYAAEWKIHPVVEDAEEYEDDLPPDEAEEEDLEDLPFDTSARN